MNDTNFKIYWGIRNIKMMSYSRDSLSSYLQGCRDSGIRQDRLDKILYKVNSDLEEERK